MTADETRALIRADAKYHPRRSRRPLPHREADEWPMSSWAGKTVPELVPDSAPIAALLLEHFLANICGTFEQLSVSVSGLSADLRALRRDVRGIADELSERPIVRYATLSDLGTPHFSLMATLPIVIEEYIDEVVARWPEIEATGSGSSEPEAIQRLREEVVELMNELSSSAPEELGPEPTQALHILRRLVTPNG